MPDIGRNDPCPCGSGKKYKKCHGTTQQPKYLSDSITEKVKDLYLANSTEIMHKCQQTREELAVRKSELLVGDPHDAPGTQTRLEAYANDLERSIAVVVARSSPMFWLSLERRFPPWLQLSSMNALPGHEMQLLRASRWLATSLLLKHSAWDRTDWKVASDLTLEIVSDAADVIDFSRRA